MNSLDRLSIGKHIFLAIAVIIAVILALLILSQIFGEVEAQPTFKPLPPKGTFVGKASPWDARMIELDKKALDDAYQDQIHHLFSVWMKDETGQPDRAVTGALQARRAYILVRSAIEEREKR